MAKNDKNVQIPSSKFDAIKDILFGDNIQEYDERLTHIENMIEINSRAFEKAMKDAVDEITAKMDDNHQKVMSEIKSLKATKVDKKTISDALMQLSETLAK